MKCYSHQKLDAIGVCKNCHKAVCKECAIESDNILHCSKECEKVSGKSRSKIKESAIGFIIIGLLYGVAAYQEYYGFIIFISGMFLVAGLVQLNMVRQEEKKRKQKL